MKNKKFYFCGLLYIALLYSAENSLLYAQVAKNSTEDKNFFVDTINFGSTVYQYSEYKFYLSHGDFFIQKETNCEQLVWKIYDYYDSTNKQVKVWSTCDSGILTIHSALVSDIYPFYNADTEKKFPFTLSHICTFQADLLILTSLFEKHATVHIGTDSVNRSIPFEISSDHPVISKSSFTLWVESKDETSGLRKEVTANTKNIIELGKLKPQEFTYKIYWDHVLVHSGLFVDPY